MKRIFLTLVCAFQLHAMEIKRSVCFNDIPHHMLTFHLVPRLLPDFYHLSKKTNVDNGEIEESYITIHWKDIGNIASVSKHFYNAVKGAFTVYDLLKYGPKHYSLFKLLQCIKFSQYVNVTFNKEKEWWQTENEESMKVRIECKIIDISTYISVLITCNASEYFPINYHTPYIKKDSVKMSDSLQKFLDLINILKNHAGVTSYSKTDVNAIHITYIFRPTQCLLIEDAITLHKSLQLFYSSPKQQDITEKEEEGILKTFKKFFQ